MIIFRVSTTMRVSWWSILPGHVFVQAKLLPQGANYPAREKKSDLQAGLQSNVIIVLRNIFQCSICRIEETTEHR
jgi:hypothetical protein